MPDRHLFLQTATTAQYVGQILNRRLTAAGLPASLLALLTHVRDHAPVTPSAISIASGTPMTSLRDNIQRLIDRGLVRRTPNPDDGRSYFLVLTRRGQRTLEVADPAVLDAYLELERCLPRPREEYEGMFDELIGALEAIAAEPTESAPTAQARAER